MSIVNMTNSKHNIMTLCCLIVLTGCASSSRSPINSANDSCDNEQILTITTCSGDEVSAEEKRLYNMVNGYRDQYDLPSIPLSKSLSLVANRHVQDLHKNIGELTHAWSNCDYEAGVSKTYPCMWKAPQRLGTTYTGYGFENAHGGTGGYLANADTSLSSWKSSKPHNAVILNQGIWQEHPWNALGVGIYQGYAVLWFGKKFDK